MVATSAAPTVPSATLARLPRKRELTLQLKKKLVVAAFGAAVVMLAVVIYIVLKPSGPGKGFASGNGRIEATEIDVATKLPGRVQNIMVNEGDFVQVGQSLAQMQTDVLDAQRDEARAQSQQAITAVASAEAQVAARQSDTAAAQATVGQRDAELDAAQRRFARIKTLSTNGVATMQEVDDGRASLHGTEAVRRPRSRRPKPKSSGPKPVSPQAWRLSPALKLILRTVCSSQLVKAACNIALPSLVKCWAPAARFSTWLISMTFT
jgi:hypothetical protein